MNDPTDINELVIALHEVESKENLPLATNNARKRSVYPKDCYNPRKDGIMWWNDPKKVGK